MTTILLFILFACSVSVLADYARPWCPLLTPAPVCGCCGRRGWRMAT